MSCFCPFVLQYAMLLIWVAILNTFIFQSNFAVNTSHHGQFLTALACDSTNGGIFVIVPVQVVGHGAKHKQTYVKFLNAVLLLHSKVSSWYAFPIPDQTRKVCRAADPQIVGIKTYKNTINYVYESMARTLNSLIQWESGV